MKGVFKRLSDLYAALKIRELDNSWFRLFHVKIRLFISKTFLNIRKSFTEKKSQIQQRCKDLRKQLQKIF